MSQTESNNRSHVPKDYGSVTPYIVRGAAKFLDFLKQAFDAEERMRVPNEDGTLGHAEVWVGTSVIQMFDASDNWPDTPAFISLYVEDCDRIHQQALNAGAVEITKLANNAWGDRGSRVRDPFGNIWWIQSHVEELSEEEMMKRMGDPEYSNRMNEAIETFDQEMRRRK